MTKIQPARPLRRETAASIDHRLIVFEAHPKYLHLRLKGERSGCDLTYEAAIRLAWRIATEARWRQRQTRRTLRRVS